MKTGEGYTSPKTVTEDGLQGLPSLPGKWRAWAAGEAAVLGRGSWMRAKTGDASP